MRETSRFFNQVVCGFIWDTKLDNDPLELKYLKKGEADNEIEQIKIDARKQLKKYSLDKKFKKQAGETRLIKLLLLFSLSDLIFVDEVGE